jgi:hypothetical protein
MNEINERELRIFEIMKETASLFRSAFRLCVPLCLLAFVPGNMLRLFLPAEIPVSDLFGDTEQFRLYMIVVVARHVFSCLVVGGYTYLAVSRYVGKPVTAGDMFNFAMSKWASIALTGIIFLIIIRLTSAMIFPMVYFAVIFVFHRNIAAVSGERGFKALAASAALVRGSFFKRMAYGAAFLLMYVVFVSLMGGITASPTGDAALTAGVADVLLGIVIDTFGSVFLLAQAVWFVNILFVRKAINITV